MNRRGALSSLFSWLSVSLLNCIPPQKKLERKPSDHLILRRFSLPTYPPLLRQAGAEGEVSTTIQISEKGTVRSVADFSGPKLFYDEIERALRKWEFDNTERSITELRVSFRFALRGQRDQRCLYYQVSGTLPDSFLIEANPFPDTYS